MPVRILEAALKVGLQCKLAYKAGQAAAPSEAGTDVVMTFPNRAAAVVALTSLAHTNVWSLTLLCATWSARLGHVSLHDKCKRHREAAALAQEAAENCDESSGCEDDGCDESSGCEDGGCDESPYGDGGMAAAAGTHCSSCAFNTTLLSCNCACASCINGIGSSSNSSGSPHLQQPRTSRSPACAALAL